MAELQIPLVPSGARDGVVRPYPITFSNTSQVSAAVTYRFGTSPYDGPIVFKSAERDSEAALGLQRELDVARYLQGRGGERLSKCVGHSPADASFHTVVTYRGRPLAAVVRDRANWPPGHYVRAKIVDDLLQSVELLRLSGIVHGAIAMDTLHWDGDTLQIVDFGGAALCGQYPDGRPAHHGDDVLGAGKVIYLVHTGQPIPADEAELRTQLDLQDTGLRDLLLKMNPARTADVDYVFAPDPEMRPTTRVLLDRIDRRPAGASRARMVAEEEAARAEFRRLRVRQAQVRRMWEPPPPPPPRPQRPRPPVARPGPHQVPGPPPDGPTVPVPQWWPTGPVTTKRELWSRPTVIAVIALALVVVLAIALVAVLVLR